MLLLDHSVFLGATTRRRNRVQLWWKQRRTVHRLMRLLTDIAQNINTSIILHPLCIMTPTGACIFISMVQTGKLRHHFLMIWGFGWEVLCRSKWIPINLIPTMISTGNSTLPVRWKKWIKRKTRNGLKNRRKGKIFNGRAIRPCLFFQERVSICSKKQCS